MQSRHPETTGNEHIKLLEKILTLESNELTDANTSRVLHDLKLRYNEWIEADNQHTQDRNYLEYFPTEIWVQVFLRVVEDDWANILSLMQVCQHWASMIISEPRLWTSIYIRSDVESLELAYSGLHLSKDLPLYVKLEFPIDFNTQRTFLQNHTRRIRHLQFESPLGDFSDWDYEQLAEFSASVLKDMGPLPSLHSLDVVMYFNEDENRWSRILVNLDAPQVKCVNSAVIPQDLLETSRYTQMHYLRTSSALETVLPELVKFSDLKQLSLLARPEPAGSISRSESSIDVYKNIVLLESLQYFQAHSDFIWPLLRQISSSLRVLELETAWKNLPKLFTIIRDANYLHDLSLYILALSTLGELHTDQWKAPALPQVQILSLEMTDHSVEELLPDTSDFLDAAHPVIEALDNSLLHVRTLHLMSDIYTNDLVRLVRTMESLTSLEVSCTIWNDGAGSDKVICPTLKTLRTRYQDVMYYLIMPNLTSIMVTEGGPSHMVENETLDRSFASTVQSISLQSRGSLPILASGRNFTQLRTLEWYSCHYAYHYQDGSFPYLTKITFRDERLGMNAFCESLLRYPRLCPSLETICSEEYPEWDILLYMLLRRNIHHGQNNSSRITRIEIAGFPAPCILVPLRDLLLGKIPLKMPSPEELSFVGIEDIYFDPRMYVDLIFTNPY
jgi:hypothetical protein